MFNISYHKKVIEIDIPKISSDIKERIKKVIESKLTTRPEIFGKPLQSSLYGFRSLRAGDYRIIFIIENKKDIFIIMIEHRSIVYKDLGNRI